MGMLDCLGRACRDARTNAGVRQLDVATSAGTSHASISRFENGRSWPRVPLDRILDAYAAETGVPVHAICREALEQLIAQETDP